MITLLKSSREMPPRALLMLTSNNHIITLLPVSVVATVGGGVRTPFVANAMPYLVTFIQILQNLYFIYPI